MRRFDHIPLSGAEATVQRPNILFITLDQFRGGWMSCAGHPVVHTPHLDALAAAGVRFARHYAQAAPCSPGRAALYTGTYQMTNRVVANGTPLDARFDNVALMARRAGYEPALFGYTDQGVDPRTVSDPTDARLSTYEGLLPGFDWVLRLVEDHEPWLAQLRAAGYPIDDPHQALRTESERPAEHSVSSFLTDSFVDWAAGRDQPWFAHLSYLRPHPPFAAAGAFAAMYDPEAMGDPLPVPETPHPLHAFGLRDQRLAAPADRAKLRRWRAQYAGMISEVDVQVGRLRSWLESTGQWEHTVVVVTSDHAELLGDHGLMGKVGWFESSFHIPGIVRDPGRPSGHGRVVQHFTENVDIAPTLCAIMGVEVPAQCDGRSLVDFLDGDTPEQWRDAAHWEWDWRDELIRLQHTWAPDDHRLEVCHVTVRRGERFAYAHFGDGAWRCYDLVADPGWGVEVTDPQVVLGEAQALLTWRSQHLDRTLTGMLLEDGGIGRWPESAATFRGEPRS